MAQEQTTVAVQRHLDALAEGVPAEPVIRQLLDQALGRLQALCTNLLFRGYPWLALPPVNLRPEELLGGVAERLLQAMQEIRPQTVRQFFALANQHIRWELNDLSQRLDKQPPKAPLSDGAVPAPANTASELSPEGRRMLEAIDHLPEEEREAFDLVRIQGLTYLEATEVLGVSVETVQRHLNRSLVLLAEQLDDLRPT
jgi:RNA polymerase sigma-70 factor (ECF subfamily)